MKKLIGGVCLSLATIVAPFATVMAEEFNMIPNMSYRVGPFSANGTMIANGFHDYFEMLNQRDGGMGGVKFKVVECETEYNAQKGVECYEQLKDQNPLVHTPNSTGITLQIIPKAPVDKTPILTVGYGLSAAAKGEFFPYAFNYPASYWSQMTSILTHINSVTGLEGKKIAFLFLESGYGREPIPVLEALGPQFGFEHVLVPVAGADMQNQSSHWLTIRKEKPDWVIMWGWGAMNPTALKEAAKTRFPMDRFIGNWWAGAHVDAEPAGMKAKGYSSANFTIAGTDFPAVQDILSYVVDKGIGQSDRDMVGKVLYNRGMGMAVIISEAVRAAQAATGKSVLTGEDMKVGLESFVLDAARLEELGLSGFTAPIKGSCADHEGQGSIFIHTWNGEDWEKSSDLIPPMTDIVGPLLTAAAEKYVSDKPEWVTQKCN